MTKDNEKYQAYVQILNEELIPAMGCTEPIALAYAAAKAREVLGCLPDRVCIGASGSIIKNVKSVIVPNTNHLKGIPAAAAAGIVAGNAKKELEVISEVTEEETTKAVSDSTEEGLTEEESTVEMVDVTRWVFTQDNKTQRVDESDDIHDLLVNMVGLTFNDCADYYADEEEKESYGLTDDAAVLTITYQSGEEETTLKLTIGATTEDDAYYYVSMDDSDQVNTVSKESVDAVLDAISGYEM